MDNLIAMLNGDRPPGIYQVQNLVNVDELAMACRGRGWRFFYLNGATISNKAQFLQQCAEVMNLPDYFGHNWDAFEECLRDLDEIPTPRHILLYDQPEHFAQNEPKEWAIALDILQDTVEYLSGTNTPMYVLFHTAQPMLTELESL